jgi:uncharacterized protein
MKIFLRVFLLTLCYWYSSNLIGQELPPRPNPPQLVNDFAGLLQSDERAILEQKLHSFDDSTGTQIAVVIMQSTGLYEINDYTQRLAQEWGVGQAKSNNGIMLLVALEDRKISIQTGYGIEGYVTDAASKQIIQNEIKPFFKEKRYFEGLMQGTDALIQLTKGAYKVEKKDKKSGKGSFMLMIIIIIIVLIFIFSNRGNRGGGKYGRYSSRGISMSDAMVIGSLFGGGRGSGWGGGSGGGGFGGFGGGSFGGGGASGDW